MKIIFALLFIVVALAIRTAQGAESKFDDDLDVLVERGDRLLTEAQKLYDAHKNASREFLLPALEFAIKELDETMKQMKLIQKQLPQFRSHTLNELEEKMLNQENALWEELAFVEEIYANHIATNQTANELVEYGDVLLRQAREEITKEHSEETKRDLGTLVEMVGKSVQKIKNNQITKITEQLLIQYERQLQQLIAQVHHSDGKPPLLTDIDVLIDKADQLLEKGQKLLSKHKDNNRGHLLDEAQHELKNLETCTDKMRALEKNSSARSHELNSLQEDLLHSENRFWEEMTFVEEVFKSATDKSTNELIDYGLDLVKQAKVEIEKHKAEMSRTLARTISIVTEIEKQIKKIQDNQANNETEQTLLRQEKTLRSYVLELQHPEP